MNNAAKVFTSSKFPSAADDNSRLVTNNGRALESSLPSVDANSNTVLTLAYDSADHVTYAYDDIDRVTSITYARGRHRHD